MAQSEINVTVELAPKSKEILNDIKGILDILVDFIEDCPWKETEFKKIRTKFRRIIRNLELKKSEKS